MQKIFLALTGGVVLAAALATATAAQAAPIKVMLLDGDSANAHPWPPITAALKQELDEAGIFQTDIVTAPKAADGDFSSFKPDFSKYQVVVLNYDAQDWPAELKTSFEAYVKNGGGLVTVHAAETAFPNWKEFNEMVGASGFRGRTDKDGPMWFMKDGKLVSDNTPGNAGAHGRRTPYLITVQNPTHPIMQGLPKTWMHQGDELYNKLRGPGTNMTVLASAFSDPANAGTGRDEPQMMVIAYGKGRVFNTVAGHDAYAMSSVDFLVTFQRGTEWAATGKVTQKVPADFPTAQSVSYRPNIAAFDPSFKNGLNALTAPAGGGGRGAGGGSGRGGTFGAGLSGGAGAPPPGPGR
jgi:type 1 glutamine amidotransferase